MANKPTIFGTEFEKTTRKFAKGVIAASRQRLTKNGHNASGKLYQSLDYKFMLFNRSYSLDFFWEDYGEFIDKGVKGVKSSDKAPKSPYRYKDKKPPIKAIESWVRIKRFQSQNKKGQFLSYKQTAFAARQSVYNYGIPATEFFSASFRNAFPKYVNQVGKSVAIDTEKMLASVLREQYKQQTNGNNSNS